MIEIGSILKEARTRKALSLDDVYSKIKIHPTMLQCLEEGRFKDLPSPFFVKHFLKTYSEFLELKTEDLLRKLEKGPSASSGEEVRPKEVVSPSLKKTKPMGVSRPKLKIYVPAAWMKIGVIAALLLAAIYFIGPLMWGWASRALEGSKKIRIGLSESTGIKKVSVKKQTASASVQRAPATEKAMASEWLRSPDQKNFPVLRKNTELELQITALEPVWIKVACDGKVLFQSILKPDNSEIWKAKESIEIKSGNPSSMRLSLNQYDLGSPGRGAVRKFLVTHKGIKIIS